MAMSHPAAAAVPNDLQALDTRHHFHPFTDHPALEAKGGARVIVRAEGVNLWDTDGRRLVDAMAGLWCVNIGYGRPELADHPLVGEVRGVGMLGALQLAEDPATRKRFEPEGDVGALCRERCFANGLVMRSAADSMVLSPPLVITRAEIDEIIEKARQALDETMDAIARPGGIAAGAAAGAGR